MSHLRQIKKTTRGLLAALGTTPDEVAEQLENTGVQGVPRDNRSCAVALYLSAVMGPEPRIRSVAVGPCSLMITLVSPADARPAGRLWVQLPKPVRGFVSAFDAREYPGITRDTPASPVSVRPDEVTLGTSPSVPGPPTRGRP